MTKQMNNFDLEFEFLQTIMDKLDDTFGMIIFGSVNVLKKQ